MPKNYPTKAVSGKQRPRQNIALKTCARCGVLMAPRKHPGGRVECPGRYRARRFCSNACVGRARYQGPSDFWTRLDKGEGCWLWAGHTDRDGYGLVRCNGKQVKTHRLAYSLHHGVTLTPKDFICHTCDNPPCCNPDHLYKGDQFTNMADMVAKGRQNSIKGERVHNAILTVEIVRAILREAGGRGAKTPRGFSRSIAERFCISTASVWCVVRGKTWKHVTL